MNKKFLGFVVSHTHWDRAWYLPFQAFRLRLVRLVDELLDLLESSPGYRSFTLDGQTVLLEDYLLLRPQNKSRISALVQAGRLLIGPWYTLPDLFLPSAESIVRNLQIGRAFSREFGEPMNVGYVPDPFGHFAQLPQILRGFGISSFLFMRGADEVVEKLGSMFDWRAPDGSTVLAVYLREGYLPCSALGHPAVFGRFDGREPVPESARKRVDDTVALISPLQKERALLLPNGCDHMPPQPELPHLLKELNMQDSNIELVHGTLPEFLAAVRSENITHGIYEGDLIGNVHHPILLGVYSSRMYLKQQNRAAENAIIRLAEPLRACLARFIKCPEAESFLNEAWRLLLRNQAHDDICGCSVDEVHNEDEIRFAEVTEIARTLVTEAIEWLYKSGLQKPSGTGKLASDVFLFNPHPFPLKTRVRTSVLIPNPNGEWAAPTPERLLKAVSGCGADAEICVESSLERMARAAFLETTWGRRYTVTLDLEMAPMGYDIVHVFETEAEPVRNAFPEPLVLENSRLRVSVDTDKLAVFEKDTGKNFPEVLRFEYEFDKGDTYSFGPTEKCAKREATLKLARRHPEKQGTLLLTWLLDIPPAFPPSQSGEESTSIELNVEVSLSASESLEFNVTYVNRAKNGRLRAFLPIGFATENLLVDGHFRTTTRTVPPHREPRSRPYPGEIPYDTFHQGEFAFAENGDRRVWLANRGNPELSLIHRDGEPWFALTLHRAIGKLSVFGGAIRQCQAGPEIPTPGAQCLREFSHQFAWGTGEISRSEVTRRALVFACPVYAQEAPYLPHVCKDGATPRAMSFLEMDNLHVNLSACRPWGSSGLAIRVFNRSESIQKVGLSLGFVARKFCITDLCEQWKSENEQMVENGRVCFSLRPHEITTVVIQ